MEDQGLTNDQENAIQSWKEVQFLQQNVECLEGLVKCSGENRPRRCSAGIIGHSHSLLGPREGISHDYLRVAQEKVLDPNNRSF